MAEKKKGVNTAAIVRQLAAPIAESLGYILWDVRFVKEGADWFLRIFIDKPGGVGIDDCVAMTRAVNDPLDELDPIAQEYCLEVCSPGLGRELTRPEHFAAFVGARVLARLIRPLPDGRRELRGTLLGYEENTITLDAGGAEPVLLERAAVSKVRLLDDEDIDGGNE